MFKIIFKSKKVINKDLSKIPEQTKLNIFKSIKKLSELWLWKSNIKILNHYDLCDYKLRIWDFRILFNIDKKEIVIFRILHRRKLY